MELAKLKLVGALVNGTFVPKASLYARTYNETDIIEPLFSNEMNKRRTISRIKLKAAQEFFNSLVRISKPTNP